MTCERHGGNAGSIMCRECDLETIERDAMTTPTPMITDTEARLFSKIAALKVELAAAQEALKNHLHLDNHNAIVRQLEERAQRAEALAESYKALLIEAQRECHEDNGLMARIDAAIDAASIQNEAYVNELKRIVYLFVEAEDDFKAKEISESQYKARIRDWTDRARKALK